MREKKEKSMVLRQLIILIILMNVIDGIFTIYWVWMQMAEEANPIMKMFLQYSPIVFMAVKVFLVNIGAWILWKYHHRVLSIICIVIAFLCYLAIILYHLQFMLIEV